MALTQQQKARLAAAATALAAIASGAIWMASNAYAPAVHGALEDAGFLHAGKGGNMTDLDSPEVQPLGTGQSIVNLPPGATQQDVIPANGWSVQSVTQTGQLVTVIVKNNTGKAARFSGWLQFNPAPADAGAP